MNDPHPYLALKLASELFSKAPRELAPAERARVDRVCARQLAIEQRILTTREAAQVVLPKSSLAQAIGEIRQRYASEDEYRADLAATGLDPAALAAALTRELTVNAVLERVAGGAAGVSETDVEIFYLLHRERFRSPENRTLRHILVTIDDRAHGSERLASYRKIEAIRARLAAAGECFPDEALRHSECPTALAGGLLGTVRRGELYPELEAVAFALDSGQLSAVVESPLGFHLLHCVAIEAPGLAPLASVRAKIRAHLIDSRRNAAQKTWIASLFARSRLPERRSA